LFRDIPLQNNLFCLETFLFKVLPIEVFSWLHGSRMFDGFLSFIYPFCFDWTCTIYYSHTGSLALVFWFCSYLQPLLYLLTKGFYLI